MQSISFHAVNTFLCLLVLRVWISDFGVDGRTIKFYRVVKLPYPSDFLNIKNHGSFHPPSHAHSPSLPQPQSHSIRVNGNQIILLPLKTQSHASETSYDDESTPTRFGKDLDYPYYPDDYEDYYDRTVEDEDYAPVKFTQGKKFHKFDTLVKIIEKKEDKLIDKFLHIKTDKAPKPPKWAVEKYENEKYENNGPPIDLPPWHYVLKKK